jgi:DNA-binding response OmpR family regulator
MTEKKPCVLLVEADILVRHPLAEYLRECGYRVLEVNNAAEARALLEREPSAVDVVLAETDGASSGSGFELANWIRRNCAGIDVELAGTVAKAAEKAGDLCEEGPALAKPYDHSLVLDRIRRLMAARERNKPKR